MRNKTRTVVLLSFAFMLTILLCNILCVNLTIAESELQITVSTDKEAYDIREIVNIDGNLTFGGSKIDQLIALEVSNVYGHPLVCRTIPTGNFSSSDEILDITVTPCDFYMNPQYSFEIGDTAYFNVTIKNNDTTPYGGRVVLSVLDGIMMPISQSVTSSFNVNPGFINTFRLSVYIPEWAYIGEAKAIVSVLTDMPKNGGVPYSSEKTASLWIFRGEFSDYGKQSSSFIIQTEGAALQGQYETVFRIPPLALPDVYSVYATSKHNNHQASQDTELSVNPTGAPPQASFTYTPLEAYVNMTITFDASASSPEGYNDTIIRYEWNFGDGTPPVIKEGTYENPPSPLATHVFIQVGTFTVTLNVTDTDQLWCTTSKPIEILPPSPPKADFIFYPPSPYPNQTVTFDASSSEPGWNGTVAPPIVSYKWNFGDGNITTVSTTIIYHIYETAENYTVTLTITDAEGASDNKTQVVMVSEAPPLIGDVDGNGKVDMVDIGLCCKAYGSKPGDSNWDPRCDVYNDGKIDMKDIGMVCQHYGESI